MRSIGVFNPGHRAGGVVICAGRTFCGTFQKCSFLSCDLYVVHGATATLSDCTWRNCGSALVAHGPATAATLITCTFHNCRFGALAEAGATVAMHACTMRCSGVAVVAIGASSHVSTEHTDFSRAASADDAVPYPICGLHISDASARLNQCSLAGLEYGAAACGRAARLEIRKTSIQDCVQAIMLSQRACGVAADTRVQACEVPGRCLAFSAFQAVSIAGARAQLTRCEVHITSPTASTTAVEVSDGGRGALHLCRLVSGGCGLSVGDAYTHAVASRCEFVAREVCCLVQSRWSSLHVRSGSMTSRRVACLVHDHAELTVADACMTAATQRLPGGRSSLGAVTVNRGASGHLLRCRIHDSLVGVHVEMGRVRAKDTDVVNMVAGMASEALRANEPIHAQAYLCTGGFVDIEGGSIEDCLNAVRVTNGDPQIGVLGPGSVRMHGVTLKGYSAGVIVAQECKGELSECRFLGHSGMSPATGRIVRELFRRVGDTDQFSVAVVFHLAQRGTLRVCEFDGNKRDVIAGAEEGVCVERCTFFGLPAPYGATECIRLKSTATVNDCEFVGGGTAVLATGARAVCTVRRCKMAAGVGVGVLSTRRANVSVGDCEIRCSNHGMVADHGGAVAAEDCVCDGVRVALKVADEGGAISAKRVKARGGDFAVVASHQCDAEEDDAYGPGASADTSRRVLELEECELSGERAAVNVAGEEVEVSLLQCAISGASAGVIVREGASAHVRNSSITGCTFGMMVGERDSDLQGACSTCGRMGVSAVKHAWIARVCGPRPEARPAGRVCVHNGARARATLDNVDIRGSEQIALSVMLHGHVNAHAVRVTGGAMGFEAVVAWGVERSQFSECAAIGFAAEDSDAVVGALQVGPWEGDVRVDQALEGIRLVVEGGEAGSEGESGEG